MPSLTRGRLPSSVYWRRRLVVITLALLLVVVIAKVLGGGGSSDGGPAAALSDQHGPSSAPSTVESTTAPTTSAGTPSASVTYGPPAPPTAADSASGNASAGSSTSPTSDLPDPVGDCAASDVAVRPGVDGTAYAYDSVTLALQLHTLSATACTWHVSPDALQVRITRGGGLVWSTIDCRGAVPSKDVVVRRDSVTVLPIEWQGHRVVADACSTHAPWSKPGTFTLTASALGGEPAHTTFDLLAPGETPTASQDSSPSSTTSTTSSATGSATGSPSGRTTDATGKRTHKPAAGD